MMADGYIDVAGNIVVPFTDTDTVSVMAAIQAVKDFTSKHILFR